MHPDQAINDLRTAVQHVEDVRYSGADQRFHEQSLQSLNEGLRGSGRTTAEILFAAARALNAPDRWITVGEGDYSPPDVETLEQITESLCQGIGITLDTKRVGSVLKIKSPLSRLWSRDLGRKLL